MIGARYQDQLAELSQTIGWEIGIRPHPDEHRLKDLAKQMLSDFRPLKEPSIRRERTTVEVKLHQPPRSAQLRALSDQFEELTGYRLDVEHPAHF